MAETSDSTAKRRRLDDEDAATNKCVYVKVKGAASVDEIPLQDLLQAKSVAVLRDFAKNKNKRKLDQLDANDLRVYRTEDAFLRGEVQLTAGTKLSILLDGNSDTTPFFIDYDEPQPLVAGSDQMQQLMTMMQEQSRTQQSFMRILGERLILPQTVEREDATGYAESEWSRRCAEKTGGDRRCQILKYLYPNEQNSEQKFRGVAAHIILRSNGISAQLMGFHVHDVKNSLFLLKDLELEFQAGNFSLLPTGVTANGPGAEFQVFVSESLRPHRVKVYQKGREVKEQATLRVQGRRLKYSHLHEQKVRLNPVPSMSALAAKARRAHLKHNELPDPFKEEWWHNFTAGCGTFADRIQLLLR
ncbi:NTF2 [Symbiodinium microadriaticum]|nr:NTF2 [Symbiodinium microadriaticum]